VSDALHVAHAVLSLDTGGLERIVVDLVRHGRRCGHRVSVLCIERPGTLAPQVEALGATLVCVGKPAGVRLGTRGQVAAVLRGLRPDVLHTHQVGALFYAGRAARDLGIPVVVHTEHINNVRKAHGGYLRRLKMTWLWWWTARYARRFFCVSEDISAEMAARRIVPKHKLSVVLNGINTEPFREPVDRDALRASLGIPADALIVGSVGRLNEVKCQDLLLRAFARVRADVPAARLLLVGDGPMRTALEELAGQLGVADAVCFAGYQARPERFLGVMDVFALTSRMEGLPLAILEAWAAGLPVVASAVGGVPDLINHEQNGLLFASGDEDALTGLLGRLLRDPAGGRSLGAGGRAEVMERYDLQRMAADYERHYRALMGPTAEGSLAGV
jgi:glycosyltransferase involved in cell wall biosynthesis